MTHYTVDNSQLLNSTNIILACTNMVCLVTFIWSQYRRTVKYYDRSISILEEELGEWFVNFVIERELAKLFKHYTQKGKQSKHEEEEESEEDEEDEEDEAEDDAEEAEDEEDEAEEAEDEEDEAEEDEAEEDEAEEDEAEEDEAEEDEAEAEEAEDAEDEDAEDEEDEDEDAEDEEDEDEDAEDEDAAEEDENIEKNNTVATSTSDENNTTVDPFTHLLECYLAKALHNSLITEVDEFAKKNKSPLTSLNDEVQHD